MLAMRILSRDSDPSLPYSQRYIDPITAAGAAASLYSAISGSRTQKKALAEQQKIGRRQQALFDIAEPSYFDALNALRQSAGFAPVVRPTAPATVAQEGLAGKLGFKTPGTTPLGGAAVNREQMGQAVGQLPYTNVRADQLGIFASDPLTRMKLLSAEEQINRGLQSRLAALRTNLARRGLGGSSIAAAAETALVADAGRQRDIFGRQLALQAQQEYQQRLGALLGSLGPGLGAGGMVANMFGQQGALGAAQVGQAGTSLGQMLQNYQLTQAIRQARGDSQGGSGTGGVFDITDTEPEDVTGVGRFGYFGPRFRSLG